MSRGLRVLIVEDSEDDLVLLLRGLRRAGYEPDYRRACTPGEVAGALAAQTWELVISDYRLPEFDGLAVLELVRSSGPDVPFILVSGVIGEEQAVEAMKAGAHDFVLKSNLARLGPAVERELREAENRRQRRAAEEALRESERRFRLLVASVKDHAIIMLDPQGCITEWNAGAEAIKGWRSEEILGRHFSCCYEPAEAAAGQPQQALEVARQRGQFEEEGVRVRKDGSRHWASDVIYPVQDEAGRLEGYARITRDITGPRRQQAALRQLNRTLTALSKSAQAMMHATEEPAYLREVCRIVAEDCGHALVWIGFAEQDEGRSIRPAAHAGFEEGYLETLQLTWADTERGRGPTGTALRTGQVTRCQDMQTDPQFQPWRQEALRRGYQASIALPLPANGQAWGALTIYSREPDPFGEDETRLLGELANDLAFGITTLRGRAAQARAEAESQRQREWLRVTLTSIADAVITCDEQGRITFLNPVAEQLTGWTLAEVMGQPIQQVLRLVNEQTRQPGEDVVARVLREGRPQALANHTALIAKDGHGCPIEDSAAPILDATGRVVGVVLVFHDVSGRRLAEQKLAAAHQRTLSTLESIGDGFFGLDRNWRVTYVNERGAQLLGKTGPELLGRSLWESFPEAVGTPFQQTYERVLAEQESNSVEAFFPPLNMWFEARAYPSAEGLSVFYQDITERKQLEDTLKFLVRAGAAPGEDFFQALARHLAQSLQMDFVCIDDLLADGLAARTLAMYCDGKFEDNVAYTLKDTPCGAALGKTICCFPKEVRHRFPHDQVLQQMGAESYVGATLWSFEAKPIGLIAVIGRKPLANAHLAESILKLVAVRAAGELQRVRAVESLRRAHDELEERVQQRTLELRQTNEHLRREMEARRLTEEQLTEAELRYWTVADFTYDWEYWETPEFLLRYCSPSCQRITGYAAEEFMESPRLVQQIVHPDDAGLWRQHRAGALARAEPRVIQFRIHRKDGSVRWLEHAWQPVRSEDGMFLGIRASNRDITDRKEEELQAQRLREELAHVSRATTAGQLAASLAHELNQPLAAIHCNAETAQQLLRGTSPNVPEVKEALEDIAHDSERAGGVIQRLRALFNKTGQQRSVLQINEVIEETLGLLQSEFVLKGISAQVQLEARLPRALGNRIELQQVLLNLVLNAVEAMSECEPGQRHLQITTAGPAAGPIRISIRDSGPGIQVQPIRRLFEPFFTTKATGMGMGLAISQSILEAHDGSLDALNNPEGGATFQITLPVQPEK